MTDKLSVYKCEVCGIVVEALDGGAGEPVCCGQPMTLLTAKTADTGKEKHLPVVQRVADGIKVTVGEVPHPMEDKHYIQWIEVLSDGKAYRQFLQPGDAPEATFPVTDTNVTVREMCNLHGVWATESA